MNRSRGSLQCGPAKSGSPEPGEKVKQSGQHLCDELDDGAHTGRYLGHGMDYYVDILLTVPYEEISSFASSPSLNPASPILQGSVGQREGHPQ